MHQERSYYGKETLETINLSEDAIKYATLPYLKSHYKYRPSLMRNDLESNHNIRAMYDLQLEEGIIVDGLIAYQQNNGETFTATFEATSKETKAEVYYQLQRTLMVWDGLAIGGLLAVLGFLVCLASNWLIFTPWTAYLYPATVPLFVVGFAGLYLLFFSKVLTGVDRYCYIYAVEQFKRYNADEKWIAVGEDVFEGPTDKYLIELKDQCMKGGFGLIQIMANQNPVLISSPSRQDLTYNKKQIELLPSFSTDIQRKTNKKTKFSRNSRRLLQQAVLSRFQKHYRRQVVVLIVSLMLIFVPMYLEFDKARHNSPTKTAHAEELNTRNYNTIVMPNLNPTDSMDQLAVQPFQKIETNYLGTTESKTSNSRRSSNPPAVIPNKTIPSNGKAKKPIESSEVGLYTLSDGEIIEFPCERVSTRGIPKYLITYQTFASESFALRQATKMSGIEATPHILWLGCFDTAVDSFVLYLDLMYEDAAEAIKQRRLLTNTLQMKGDSTELRIREVISER